jgi:hypothetical protein
MTHVELHPGHSNASAAVATAVAASSNPQKWRLYKAIAVGVSVLLMFVGFITGFFTARQMGARDLTACYASISQQCSTLQQSSRASHTSALRELPPPGSAEAKQLVQTKGALGEPYLAHRTDSRSCAGCNSSRSAALPAVVCSLP